MWNIREMELWKNKLGNEIAYRRFDKWPRKKMASKKRGPYDGTSGTSKWRKQEKEEEHESNVDEIAGK